MYYLGLGDVQKVPTEYEKYVWMSERCIEGIAWSKEHNKHYTVISKNWETDKQLQKASSYLDEVKKAVMDYAAEILNQYHHTSFDINEWDIMLGKWMLAYLFTFYEKYLKLLKVEEVGGKYESDIFTIKESVVALDYTDYNKLIRTEDYGIYQYSELFWERFHFDNVKVRQFWEYEREPIVYGEKTVGYFKYLAYRIFLRGIKSIIRCQDKVVFHDSYLPFDFLLEAMKKRPGRITNYVYDYHRFERKKMNIEIDRKWREKDTFLPNIDDEFIVLMCKLLKRNLPIAYVESFGFLQKQASKLYRFAQNPNVVFFANGGSYDEVFKAYLMGIRHKKTIFCDIQHGGDYGIVRTPGMHCEYEMSDWLYTWGWAIEKNFPCHCKPMPAAKLLDKRLQNVKTGDKILYVSYTYPRRGHELYKRALIYDKDKKNEIEFLKGLSEPLKNRIIVRLFQSDFGWRVKDELDKQVTGLTYDDEKDFYVSLGKAKLVVLMVWSTTILEALYAGKPVLVLHYAGQAEESAIEDIKDLERVGILVQTWEKLGAQLEAIYQNVDQWWNDPERQKVVQRIRDKYTFMPQDAKKVWLDEILSFAEKN